MIFLQFVTEFANSLFFKKKRNKNFANRPLETCTRDPGNIWGLTIRPLASQNREGAQRGRRRPLPATAVAGGEGTGVDGLEDVESYLGEASREPR